jgi:hypothetical protein
MLLDGLARCAWRTRRMGNATRTWHNAGPQNGMCMKPRALHAVQMWQELARACTPIPSGYAATVGSGRCEPFVSADVAGKPSESALPDVA